MGKTCDNVRLGEEVVIKEWQHIPPSRHLLSIKHSSTEYLFRVLNVCMHECSKEE